MTSSRLLCAALALSLTTAPAMSQNLSGNDLFLSNEITQNGIGANFFNGNMSSFNGSACFGNACASTGESNGLSNPPLKLKWTQADIIFEDSSTSSFPDRDWRIQINDNAGLERFMIRDEGPDWTTATPVTPFSIMGGAPENAFWIADTGRIGLGTSLPQHELHIVTDDTATLRLDQQSPTFGNQTFDLAANENGFFVVDQTAGTTPFAVISGAPTNALLIQSSGNVGIGISNPTELLHIRSNAINTDAFALFEAQGSGSDSAFRLKQNGIVPSTWEFRNQQDSGRLNVGLAGGNTPFKIDNAANNNLLRLGRNGQPGEVNITGTLVVNNTALNVPDYVFADDYALRPLAEVRDFISANSHLPDVPSEAEIKANGVDMTAMQMTLLKKVEELTLYTLAQEDTIAKQQAELRELQVMKGQMARIEALLSDQVK